MEAGVVNTGATTPGATASSPGASPVAEVGIFTLKRVLIVGGLILIGGGIAYGAISLKKQYNLLMNIGVKFAGIKIPKDSAPSLTNVTLVISLSLNNTSALTVKINNIKVAVSINKKKVADVSQPVSQTIKPNGSSIYAMTVSFNPSELATGGGWTITNILDLLNLKNDTIGIHGTADAVVDGISLTNVPINIDENIGTDLNVT